MGCGCASALGVLSGAGLLSRQARATTVTPPTAMTPAQALATLVRGNREFLDDPATLQTISRQRRLALAEGQAPFAAVLCCSDSRVPPELLFTRGLGEIFTVRNAGNTVDAAAMGSIEYAVAVLKVPLLVVLGHENCGAVQAAVDVVKLNKVYPGSIGAMIEPIVPAVLQARSDDGDLLDNAVRENVKRTVRRLTSESEPMLQRPLEAGRLQVIGARYDLHEGSVEFFSP
jgi:carbonic anhydrase